MSTTNLTEEQIDAIWCSAFDQKMMFLVELCESWLDADGDALRQRSLDATIRSYIKGSKIAVRVGL